MEISKETFITILNEKLFSTDIAMVKRDVFPFIQNPKECDIWSNDYFLQLADKIRFL